MLIQKGKSEKISYEIKMHEQIKAPVVKNQKVGSVLYFCDGNKLAEFDIVAAADIEKLTFRDLIVKYLHNCITVR